MSAIRGRGSAPSAGNWRVHDDGQSSGVCSMHLSFSFIGWSGVLSRQAEGPQ
jgi:hypothetical protein